MSSERLLSDDRNGRCGAHIGGAYNHYIHIDGVPYNSEDFSCSDNDTYNSSETEILQDDQWVPTSLRNAGPPHEMSPVSGASANAQSTSEIHSPTHSASTDLNSQRGMQELENKLRIQEELQNERDVLRKQLCTVECETAELTNARRAMQKEVSDLSIQHRTNLGQHAKQLGRPKEPLEEVDDAHVKSTDTHDYTQIVLYQTSLDEKARHLREDVVHLNKQLKEESEFRGLLQHQNECLDGRLRAIRFGIDGAQAKYPDSKGSHTTRAVHHGLDGATKRCIDRA